ncbi:conserved hypothetical protein [Methanococcus maripaludis C5]|uniref:Uncharacterized protein n=1 Tax=Methanococcus maripaludis (strain C5 / ATCC BAA-1333) TaxID=402880 RepID=A4FZ54_METM5|nr:hypothetical protein [Methanococcus maripaludis]ABO35488.1 conserved hypothetical protein [Methanococcus maripaludis C5]
MDYRLHRNCICRKLFDTTEYLGLGIRRFFRMGLTSEEIKNVIKRETGKDISDEEISKISKEISEEDVIDARGRRNFFGAGRGGRMGRGMGRGRF